MPAKKEKVTLSKLQIPSGINSSDPKNESHSPKIPIDSDRKFAPTAPQQANAPHINIDLPPEINHSAPPAPKHKHSKSQGLPFGRGAAARSESPHPRKPTSLTPLTDHNKTISSKSKITPPTLTIPDKQKKAPSILDPLDLQAANKLAAQPSQQEHKKLSASMSQPHLPKPRGLTPLKANTVFAPAQEDPFKKKKVLGQTSPRAKSPHSRKSG